MSGYFLCTASARPFQTLVSSGVSDHIDQRNVPEVPPPPQAATPSKPTPTSPAPLIRKKSLRFIALSARTADRGSVRPPATRRPAIILFSLPFSSYPRRPVIDITRMGCAIQEIRRTFSVAKSCAREYQGHM